MLASRRTAGTLTCRFILRASMAHSRLTRPLLTNKNRLHCELGRSAAQADLYAGPATLIMRVMMPRRNNQPNNYLLEAHHPPCSHADLPAPLSRLAPINVSSKSPGRAACAIPGCLAPIALLFVLTTSLQGLADHH